MTMQDTTADRIALDTEPASVKSRILWAVAVFLAAVIAATATFGLPGLAMSALATVPFILVALLLITVGR